MNDKKWVNLIFISSIILITTLYISDVWSESNAPSFGTLVANDSSFGGSNASGGSTAEINQTFTCSISQNVDAPITNGSYFLLASGRPIDTTDLAVNLTNTTNAIPITNSSNATQPLISYNINLTTFPEGIYFWACGNVGGVDVLEGTLGNTTSQLVTAGQLGNISGNRTFSIDRTAPSFINLTSPIGIELTNNNTIEFNFTVIDAIDNTINCNVTVDNAVLNGTVVAYNFTSSIQTYGAEAGNISASVKVPMTSIDSGPHTWNVTCTDSAGNVNSTGQSSTLAGLNSGTHTLAVGANFTVTDTKPPTTPGVPTFDKTSVTSGSKVKITCPATSDTTTSNPTEKVSVKGPLTSDSYSEVGNSPYTITTNNAGTYTAKCRATDSASNTGSFGGTATFKVTLGSGSSADVASGGSGSSSISGTVLRGTEVEIGNLNDGDQGRGIYERGTVTFTVAGKSHSAQVTKVDKISKIVTIVINSEHQVEVTLGVGELKEVDIDNDGTNEITVELLAIDSYGKAEIVFKSLVTEKGSEIPRSTTTTQPSFTTSSGKDGISTGWIILIIIVVVGLVIFFVAKRKRG